MRDNSVYEVIENRPLDQPAIDAGVISDQIVHIGLSKKPQQRPDHPTRLICVRCSPHTKRGKSWQRGGGQMHQCEGEGNSQRAADCGKKQALGE